MCFYYGVNSPFLKRVVSLLSLFIVAGPYLTLREPFTYFSRTQLNARVSQRPSPLGY